ncbi:MAG: hypothetical protein Q7J68_06360 [Thermoplasmata archaeon]|nr:hypothetical protein [Thermoplasmata archaeon]
MRSEADLVEIIKNSFIKNDFIVDTEVQMFSKKIDVVCIDPRTKDVYAIEAKVEKWRRALQQALTYRLCSNYSYLAIPEENSSKVDQKLLSKYGIGLIIVNQDNITILQDATNSNVLYPRMKEEIIHNGGGLHSPI